MEIQNFINNMQSYHYIPLVSKPTRFPTIESHQPSLLDHVWVNDINLNYACDIISNDLTDHCPLFLRIHFGSIPKTENFKIKFRLVSEENRQKFENEIGKINWTNLRSENVNYYTENFMNTLNSKYCQCFPIKIKSVS